MLSVAKLIFVNSNIYAILGLTDVLLMNKIEDIAVSYQQIRFYRCMSELDLAFLHRPGRMSRI